MSALFQIEPPALRREEAAQFVGLSVRQFDYRVKKGEIRKQPDGAFSVKHLREYQARQEMAAECEVYSLEHGDVAREEEGMDIQPPDTRGAEVVHERHKRGRRRPTGKGVATTAQPWPEL